MSGWRPKGEYPRGKLNANDQGKAEFSLLIKGNTLVIDFGKQLSWIGLGLTEVTQLRELLEKCEKQLREMQA